ncbi:MAG: ABC transporter ATP-binding protein [Chitinophagaceae bacterium]|nr:ABC transporter ATP-binding protein [Chitinophagaceae bacterium]
MGAIIKVEDLSKQYRLGQVSTGTISHDINRWWHKVRSKEDPYLKIGETNDRTSTGNSEYVWALKDINFEVQQGEVLGIIGRNGAGKSTLLKILSRTTAPTTGSIKIKGRVASLLEVGTGFHPELSGRENIFLNGAILGMTKKEIARNFDEIVAFAGVERYIDTPVKRYSSGMYVRLAFAVAAHLEPDILIVDEVLAVGDAEFQKKCIGKMKDVSDKDGRTVLFVSHNMGAVKSLCTRAVSLKHGSIDFAGTVADTISAYMQSNNDLSLHTNLEELTDRAGNQKVVFSTLHLENENNQQVDKILTGSNVKLVFRLKVNDPSVRQIDLGFSFHNVYDDIQSYLYSSFQKFEIIPDRSHYITVHCTLENFPFSEGRLFIKGRMLADGYECDWPKDVLGIIDVEYGDFYKTGTVISNIAPFLINGKWALAN